MNPGGGSHPEEDGLEALLAQASQGKISPEATVGLDRHAHALDHAHLEREDFAGQAVRGDGLHRHAARA